MRNRLPARWECVGEDALVSHLPEDVVNGVAQKSFSVVGRQQLRPQYRHELLKVHLAVPCRWTRDKMKSDSETGSSAEQS